MLFNSIEFLFFLPIVFVLYWFVFNKKLKHQNLLILVSSYFFYGWWDYRFLILIILSTIVDYFIGINIAKEISEKKKKRLLLSSIIFNLGVLGGFKYYNFFIESWVELFNVFGYKIKSIWTLKIILPVGISFYTFQTMSYTIDIYKKKLTPTKDFISFASFVAFFPQLVAGPIERAKKLLPQILTKRKFQYNDAIQGLRLILWGMFKKVVIADSLAPIVNEIFNNHVNYNGGILWLGAIYFAFQIYCDFSGYSDIAIGTSKLFGFDMMSNFRFPYLSRNIGEFWRRWHISLSTWFRDYLYIPLGGSKQGKWKSLRNIFIIFIVSGFWHGANWTFIAWGVFHAILFIPSFLFNKNRKYLSSIVGETTFLPTLTETLQIGLTFILVSIGWVFFRSENLSVAFNIIQKLFLEISIPFNKLQGIGYILFIFCFDYTFRKNERNVINYKSKYIRYAVYLFLTYQILSYFNLNHGDFIYFQF